MLTINRSFLLLLIPLLCWCACEKGAFAPRQDQPTLPAITTSGAGTFGCRINGEVFLHTPRAFDDHITVYYDALRKTFQLHATESVNDRYNRSVGIYAEGIEDVGLFELSTMYYRDHDDSDCQTVHGLNEDHLFEEDPFILEVLKFDSEERIISGIFHFTVISEVCGDTIRITDGRFDMPWYR